MKTGSHTPAQIARHLEEAIDRRSKLEAEASAIERDREAVLRKLDDAGSEIERLAAAFIRTLPPAVQTAIRRDLRGAFDGEAVEDEGEGVRASGGDSPSPGVPG